MKCTRISPWPFLVVLALIPRSVFADWIAGGVPVAMKPGYQGAPHLVSDGAGGVIVFWYEGDLESIYAQRINGNGDGLWAPGGVPVCPCAAYQSSVRNAVTDGAGGAIVSWVSNANGDRDLFAGRINSDGQFLWATPVATDFLFGDSSNMIADGSGGVVLVWERSNIYAQRLDSAGHPQWPVAFPGGGLAVCEAPDEQYSARLALDGTGGVFVSWTDRRRSYWEGQLFEIVVDAYAQRLNGAGEAQWVDDGISLRDDASANGIAPGLSRDAVVVYGFFDGLDLRAQRVGSNGAPVWPSDANVCIAPDYQNHAEVFADGADGFLVVWQDERVDYVDTYAQRLDPNGSSMWTPDGVPLASGPGIQTPYASIGDGLGGLISVMGGSCCGSIWVQRLDPSGQKPWGPAGVFLNAGSMQAACDIELDGTGGVVCAWSDNRNGNWDVYVQRFDIATGEFGIPTAVAIASFEAEARAGTVMLQAEFRSNLEVEGVNVYRRTGTDPWVRHASLLPAGEGRFEYIDDSVVPGTTYQYQLGVVDPDGEFLSTTESVTIPRASFSLDQNRPNPFNPSTTIRFTLSSREHATVVIYDAEGRRVRELLDAAHDAGEHQVEWDGRDSNGVVVGSGVYFYRLSAGKQMETKKMVLLK